MLRNCSNVTYEEKNAANIAYNDGLKILELYQNYRKYTEIHKFRAIVKIKVVLEVSRLEHRRGGGYDKI